MIVTTVSFTSLYRETKLCQTGKLQVDKCSIIEIRPGQLPNKAAVLTFQLPINVNVCSPH